MISPPPAPQQAVAPPSPPEFFFLGTQSHQTAHLLPSLRDVPKPTILPALDPFVEAVFFSTGRVWILDPHFDHLHGLPPLFEAKAMVESQAEFRVISRKEMPREWLTTQANWGAVSRRLSWQKCEHAWLHGRFALVDHQLWHFGSTVGGAYPGFDAASRWFDPALVASFQYHFEHVWGDAR